MKYISKHRQALFAQLSAGWFKEGHPVCFVEGSPGIGKTDLTEDLEEYWERHMQKPHAYHEVPDASAPLLDDSLFELAGRLNDQGVGVLAAAIGGSGDLIAALIKTLEQPVLIIVDEVQRLFQGATNHPATELARLLSLLKSRRTLPGRLLLVSDRMIERTRWSESFEIHRLEKLEPQEAETVLDDLLKSSGRQDDVPASQRRDLVMALDRNPRALQALVAVLEYDSLEAIMSQDRGCWATTDRDVSPDLLRKLELELLERTLARIEPRLRDLLQRLAVHRKGVEKGALHLLCRNDSEFQTFRDSMIHRFLLQHRNGWFTLNPIAREISLAQLRKFPADLRQAHASAANYHLGPFKAREMTGEVNKLSARFAELRYHLVNSGRAAELRDAIFQFSGFLKRELSSGQSIPPLGAELDERIGVLAVLLEEPGPKSLEQYLARLLLARAGPGDLAKAALHAERAIGPGASIQIWLIHVRLQNDVHGVDKGLAAIKEAFRQLSDGDQHFEFYHLGSQLLCAAARPQEAISLLRQGLLYVPRERNRFALYQRCAEVLVEQNESGSAIELLREGIKDIPADKSVVSLYQSCAELIERAGRPAEAIDLLEDGIGRIPVEKNVSSLYQSYSQTLCRLGRPEEAIAKLRAGVARTSRLFGGTGLVEALFLLCLALARDDLMAEILAGMAVNASEDRERAFGRVIQLQSQQKWREAATAAGAARRTFPPYFSLATQEAFCWLCCDEPWLAREVFATFPLPIEKSPGAEHEWLQCFIHLRLNEPGPARRLLQEYLGRDSPADDPSLDESLLLRLWDGQVAAPDVHYIAFYHPLLPPSLTGLPRSIRRIQFGPPALPMPAVSTPLPPAGSALKQPRVFISHSKTDKPFVRRLVGDLKKLNHIVWFDEQELKTGDSIVAGVSDGLKNTDYLIVVLSAASLASKWVQAELNAALMDQLSKGGVTVLPALIENCGIPPLLQDRIYADFRTSYEHGLGQLAEVLAMEFPPAAPTLKSDAPAKGPVLGDDCVARLKTLSLADLRRRLVARLNRNEISTIWWDVFEESMDDQCPNATTNTCVIELLDRAKRRQKLSELHRVLCAERPDLGTA